MIDEVPSPLERAEQLLFEGKYREAYHACEEILKVSPGNGAARALERRIEQAMETYNRAILKDALKQIAVLKKQKRFPELLVQITTLRQYFPYDETLQQEEEEIKKRMFDVQMQAVDDALKIYDQELAALYEKDRDACLQKTYELQKQSPMHQGLLALMRKWRTKYVEDEIAKREAVFTSGKYEFILQFLRPLYEIEPSSTKVQSLIKTYETEYVAHTRAEQKEFLFRSLEHLDTLMKLKKYDKAVEVALEILHLDPENQRAHHRYQKASRKRDRAVRKEVIAQIIASARTVPDRSG